MHAVFRCDASPTIGAGHAMRCDQLGVLLHRRGWKVTFAVNSAFLTTLPGFSSRPFTFLTCPDSNESTVAFLLSKPRIDLLVVDHYAWSSKEETSLRPWANRIAVIDDLDNRPHDCDLLIDATPAHGAARYCVNTAPDTIRLLGPKYALLRPEFKAQRQASKTRRFAQLQEPLKIVISFGMTDPRNLTAQVLRLLEATGRWVDCDVILGECAACRRAVEQLCHRLPWAKLHIDPPSVASVLAKADFVIGAAGSSSWERCCLGLPSLSVQVADNQSQNIEGLRRAGATLACGTVDAAFAFRLLSGFDLLAKSTALRYAMAKRAFALCDGLGLERSVAALNRLFDQRKEPTNASTGRS